MVAAKGLATVNQQLILPVVLAVVGVDIDALFYRGKTVLQG